MAHLTAAYDDPIIVDVPENPDMTTRYEELKDAVVSAVPLQEIERRYAKYVLARCGGNVTHAAEKLGINRRTIQRWTRQDGKR